MIKTSFVFVLIFIFLIFSLSGKDLKQKQIIKHTDLLPDLTVATTKSLARLQISIASSSIPNIIIKNIGKASAEKIAVFLFISQSRRIIKKNRISPHFKKYLWQSTKNIAFLGAGQSQKLILRQPIKLPKNLSPGQYYFNVFIDPENNIIELNEKNNKMTQTIKLPFLFPISISSLSQTFFWSSGGGTEELNIGGSGFGSTIGNKTVQVGTVSLNSNDVEYWSPTSIIMALPGDLAYGQTHVVFIKENGIKISNSKTIFLKMDVTELFPMSGAAGITIQVKGIGFGSSQGTKKVKFGTHEASIVSWGPTNIEVIVPNIPIASYEVYIEKSPSLLLSSSKTFSLTN